VLPKRSLRSLSTEPQERTYKKAENHKPREAVANGTALQGRTAARATTHGRASGARAPMHPCRTPVPCAVFLCFAILDARGFLKPLMFLEIVLEVFLSIETQGFLLKRRQNAF